RLARLTPGFDPNHLATVNVGAFPPDSGSLAKPRIVSDGERFLVVWEVRDGTGHDLMGALVTNDQVGTSFTIARRATLASLVAVSPGRFLLAYETQDDA